MYHYGWQGAPGREDDAEDMLACGVVGLVHDHGGKGLKS